MHEPFGVPGGAEAWRDMLDRHDRIAWQAIVVREDGDVTGLAVNIAARVQQAAAGGTTWASSTVRDLLLGGDWSFPERGEHVLKGVDGAWRLYALEA